MELVAAVEPRLVGVAAVAVLHDELADADQAASGARLVAELRLEVVDDQRQLTVALHDVAQQLGDDLLVGHGEHHVAPGPVLEARHLGADLRRSGRSRATGRPGARPASPSPARRWRRAPRG